MTREQKLAIALTTSFFLLLLITVFVFSHKSTSNSKDIFIDKELDSITNETDEYIEELNILSRFYEENSIPVFTKNIFALQRGVEVLMRTKGNDTIYALTIMNGGNSLYGGYFYYFVTTKKVKIIEVLSMHQRIINEFMLHAKNRVNVTQTFKTDKMYLKINTAPSHSWGSSNQFSVQIEGITGGHGYLDINDSWMNTLKNAIETVKNSDSTTYY